MKNSAHDARTEGEGDRDIFNRPPQGHQTEITSITNRPTA